MVNSKDMKIKLLLKGLDGTVLFIEFMQDGKSKILSYENFIKRYGAAAIKSIKSMDEVGVTCKITKKKYNLVIKL